MGDSNMQKAIRALLSPANDLEIAMQQVLTLRSVDNARGAQLDVLGRIVGRARQGIADDEVYRRLVRAQISANKSDGLIEDILTIARLVVNDPDATMVLRNEGIATYTLSVEGIALSDEIAGVLMELLLKATSAAVRVILEYSTADPGDVLRWGTQGVWGTGVWARAIDTEI